jgi:hypothetical protein
MFTGTVTNVRPKREEWVFTRVLEMGFGVCVVRQCADRDSIPAGETAHKLALIESTGGGKLLSLPNENGNFVGNLFQLPSSLASVLCWEPNGHTNKLILSSDSIMGISESADESGGTKVWAGVQTNMESLSVRTIDNRNLLRESNEGLSAMRAFFGVSPHWSPLIPEPMT